jgi:thiamine-monophosphate kinase
LFSAPAAARAAVQRAAEAARVGVGRIGTVQAEAGLRVRMPDGRVLPQPPRSFDHFAGDA